MREAGPSFSSSVALRFPSGLNPRGVTGLLPAGLRGIIQTMTCAELQCQTCKWVEASIFGRAWVERGARLTKNGCVCRSLSAREYLCELVEGGIGNVVEASTCALHKLLEEHRVVVSDQRARPRDSHQILARDHRFLERRPLKRCDHLCFRLADCRGRDLGRCIIDSAVEKLGGMD